MISLTESANVVSANLETSFLTLNLKEEKKLNFPYQWLRDNCQCEICYDHQSHTRRLLLDQWGHDDKPVLVKVSFKYIFLRFNLIYFLALKTNSLTFF